MNTTNANPNFEALYFEQQGWVPNNPTLPALLYAEAKHGAAGTELAEAFEATFAKNGWPAQWRAGVYNYHHYHSTAHEVLGCFSGSSHLIIGGPGGRKISVVPGTALVLPVGTGHCCVWASDDFKVVGAYPEGQEWDICTQSPTAEMKKRIEAFPLPDGDPVDGLDGPVVTVWKMHGPA